MLRSEFFPIFLGLIIIILLLELNLIFVLIILSILLNGFFISSICYSKEETERLFWKISTHGFLIYFFLSLLLDLIKCDKIQFYIIYGILTLVLLVVFFYFNIIWNQDTFLEILEFKNRFKRVFKDLKIILRSFNLNLPTEKILLIIIGLMFSFSYSNELEILSFLILIFFVIYILRSQNVENGYLLLSFIMLYSFRFFFNGFFHEDDDWTYFGAVIRYPSDSNIITTSLFGYHSPGYFISMKYLVLVVQNFSHQHLVFISFLGVLTFTSFGFYFSRKLLYTKKEQFFTLLLLIIGWQGFIGFITLSSPQNFVWHFFFPLLIYFSWEKNVSGALKRILVFIPIIIVHLPSFLIFFIFNEIFAYIRKEKIISLMETTIEVIILIIVIFTSNTVWIGLIEVYKPIFLQTLPLILLFPIFSFLMKLFIMNTSLIQNLFSEHLVNYLFMETKGRYLVSLVSFFLITGLLIIFSSISDYSIGFFLLIHIEIGILALFTTLSIFKQFETLDIDIWSITMIVMFGLALTEFVSSIGLPTAADPWRVLALSVIPMAIHVTRGMSQIEKLLENHSKFIKEIPSILIILLISFNFTISTSVWFKDKYTAQEVDVIKSLGELPIGYVISDPRYFSLISTYNQKIYAQSLEILRTKFNSPLWEKDKYNISYIFWSNNSIENGNPTVDWVDLYQLLTNSTFFFPIIIANEVVIVYKVKIIGHSTTLFFPRSGLSYWEMTRCHLL